MNQVIMAIIETKADREGTGSIWRGCLAIKRSCENKALGNLVLQIGYQYCSGQHGLQYLESFCIDHANSPGEFGQAVIALRNAIEMLNNHQI